MLLLPKCVCPPPLNLISHPHTPSPTKGFAIDKAFPHCCAVVCCCVREETCQHCMLFGDNNIANLWKVGVLCLYGSCLQPALLCQLCCLVGDGTGAMSARGSPPGAPQGMEMVR